VGAKLGLDVLAGCGIRALKIAAAKDRNVDGCVLNAFGALSRLSAASDLFRAARQLPSRVNFHCCGALPAQMETFGLPPEKLGNQQNRKTMT